MIEILIINIDRKLNGDEYGRLLHEIDPNKRARIQSFINFDDAQRSLLGDILVRHAVCQRLNIENKEIKFNYNQYGKPSLISHPEVYFNISHTKNWVACVVDDEPVGIDIETLNPNKLVISKTFFSKDEYFDLMNQSENNRLEYFFIIWTLKESYIKAVGKGLNIPLKSFSVNVREKCIFTDSRELYFLEYYCVDKGAILGLCSHKEKVNLPRIYTLDEFILLACKSIHF